VSKTSPIPTPVHVRWQRLQYQIIPLLAVMLCSAVAWRLWRESPQTAAVGQVNTESVNAASPASGTLIELSVGKGPRLFDSVTTGQILARVEHADGKLSDVIAPRAGQIISVHHEPGQAVNTGQALFTVAADHGRYVTTYLRADQRAQPTPGMAVDVRGRSPSSKTVRAIVERIGPQYQAIPAAQLRDRKAEEWGLPVIIALPPEASLRPGELVYIGWLSEPATAPSADQASDSGAGKSTSG
jgi:multidrug resistance efflux pump